MAVNGTSKTQLEIERKDHQGDVKMASSKGHGAGDDSKENGHTKKLNGIIASEAASVSKQ